MNATNILDAVSDKGMSTKTAAAVGGGAAGGIILLLSLLALCCCWSKHYAKPKYPQVHLNNDRSRDNAYRGDLIPNEKGGSL